MIDAPLPKLRSHAEEIEISEHKLEVPSILFEENHTI